MVKASDIYPITTIEYPNGHKMSVISDAHLKAYTPPIKLDEILYEMRGQTRIEEGYYVGDIERAINHKPVLD